MNDCYERVVTVTATIVILNLDLLLLELLSNCSFPNFLTVRSLWTIPKLDLDPEQLVSEDHERPQKKSLKPELENETKLKLSWRDITFENLKKILVQIRGTYANRRN